MMMIELYAEGVIPRYVKTVIDPMLRTRIVPVVVVLFMYLLITIQLST